jgi:poly(hydroxyalkanoate) granule-associated protein
LCAVPRRYRQEERTMLKKAKAEAGAKRDEPTKDPSQTVRESSRQIWLAGLGAFSKAQAGGVKLFETLVKQGEALETKTRQVASDTASAARGAATAKAKEMQAMAGGTWDKLEQVFEDRVARALSRLGVYTQNDVERLAARVDVLSESVNELINATGVKPKRRVPPSTVGRMVKGAVHKATKTAAGAARTATGAVTSATKTAKRTVRTAKKVAKAMRG